MLVLISLANYNECMNNLRPSSKIILTFIISFIVTYSLMNVVISQIKHREQLVHKEAAEMIQKEISERFNLALDGTLLIGQMASLHFYNQDKADRRFEELIDKIIKEKEYTLGLSQLDADGKIIAVYPEEDNQQAMGKTTQNYEELLKSYKRGEKYWFSPPFKLFQGGSGFVFYIPIENKGKLIGWMAPVISSQLFFEHFRTMDFFSEYDLVIKDELTGGIYFETSIPPDSGKVEEVRSKMQERSIIFLSWPKTSEQGFTLSFTWRFLICLLASLFFGLVMKLHLQKKKAYSRLENISDLLKLTSNEALSKLMDIQTEYLATGPAGVLNAEVVEKDVQSVTNLIEQIELLQNMAASEQLEEEEFEILPLFSEHLEVLGDIIKKKKLDLRLNIESFKGIKITGNKWLVSNTVIKNSLSYSVLIACPEGRIEISHIQSPKECSTVFHIDKVYEEEVHRAFKIERRLLVAQNVMDLLNGRILIYDDGPNGKLLKLTMNL